MPSKTQQLAREPKVMSISRVNKRFSRYNVGPRPSLIAHEVSLPHPHPPATPHYPSSRRMTVTLHRSASQPSDYACPMFALNRSLHLCFDLVRRNLRAAELDG